MAKKKKFYKKAKPKTEPKKLPRNYRFITEKIHSDHLIFFIGITCIIIATIIVSFDLYSNYKTQKQLTAEKVKVVKELAYWQKEVGDKPNYRDGYFSLALIYYQLKDFENSSENLDRAMNIDPNFEKGKELRVLLEEE